MTTNPILLAHFCRFAPFKSTGDRKGPALVSWWIENYSCQVFISHCHGNELIIGGTIYHIHHELMINGIYVWCKLVNVGSEVNLMASPY